MVKKARPRLIGDLWRSDLNIVDGWVHDPDEPDERLVVNLVIDGVAVALSRGETLVQNEPLLSGTDRCFGFRFFLPDPVLESARELWVELANSRERIGRPLVLGATPLEGERQVGLVGQVAWYGGLRLHGTIERPTRADLVPMVRLYEDGQLISTIHEFRLDVDANRQGTEGAEYLVFDTLLPARLADGLPHEIRVLDGLDRELAGSPVLVLGAQGGLFKSLSALNQDAKSPVIQALSQHFDRLIPGSLGFCDLEAWKTLSASSSSMESCSDQGLSIIALNAPWMPGQGLQHLDPLIVFLDREASLLEGTAQSICATFQTHPEAMIGYGDALVDLAEEGPEPLFRPAFDGERLRFQDYTFGITIIRGSYLSALLHDGSFSSGLGSTREIWTDLLRRYGPLALARSAIHIPDFLVRLPREVAHQHLLPKARTFDELPGMLGIRPEMPLPEVEIIIPTRDRLDLLRPCLETLLDGTDYPNYRILILDNGSEDPETLDYLHALPPKRVRVLRDDGPFNYSRLNNRAVEASSAPLILLLNNDVEILDAHWLRAMVLHLQSSADLGAVGAKLLWPNQQIQHGGVILGTNFGAVHSHNDRQDGEAGYGAELLVPREASAVTAACLLCRRESYLAVGGLDPVTFPVAFNDVDLCLKFRAAGLRNLWTPFARLLHRESASRGRDQQRRDEARLFKELNALRRKWGRTLMSDPYYHPALNLDPTPFTGLALNPRPLKPRFNSWPQPDRSLDPWGALP